mmetsp:Transcript_189/g.171  ORF Transcript_189/g.171 Transcript_189/m.171 type:complete len:201 (+) Transcript_189:334-936(+)
MSGLVGLVSMMTSNLPARLAILSVSPRQASKKCAPAFMAPPRFASERERAVTCPPKSRAKRMAAVPRPPMEAMATDLPDSTRFTTASKTVPPPQMRGHATSGGRVSGSLMANRSSMRITLDMQPPCSWCGSLPQMPAAGPRYVPWNPASQRFSRPARQASQVRQEFRAHVMPTMSPTLRWEQPDPTRRTRATPSCPSTTG